MLNLLRLEPGVESRAEVFRLFFGFFIQKNLIIRETKGAESRRKFFGSTALQKYLKITFSPLSARLHIPASCVVDNALVTLDLREWSRARVRVPVVTVCK